MAMTPSEKKYHELRKENKVLKKEITELTCINKNNVTLH